MAMGGPIGRGGIPIIGGAAPIGTGIPLPMLARDAATCKKECLSAQGREKRLKEMKLQRLRVKNLPLSSVNVDAIIMRR